MIAIRSASPLVLALAFIACGHGHAPFAGTGSAPGRGDGADAGLFIHLAPPPPPSPDAGGLCGNQIIPLAVDRPNLYFVLDASGSMSDSIDPSGHGVSKYRAAYDAIEALLLKIGSRVSYGAAVFPGNPTSTTDFCPVGRQVFPTVPGDSVAYAISGKPGPTLEKLLRAIGGHSPTGLTPTAASLQALKGQLLSLKGKTYAFLLTDGAPNCDANLPCSAGECTINIESGCGAPAGVSCCTTAYGADNRWCLDADPTTAAIADLEANGIQTFIIGMPGTSAYAGFLDRLASAGGTARPSIPEYYPVTGLDDLVDTLDQIGRSVAISCDIPLDETPPDRSQVNVYFDQTILPEDPENGWTWTSPDASVGAIRIVGNACTLLESGSVFQVQVVAGCPTQLR